MHWNRKHLSVFEFRVEKNGITPSMPQELLFELNGARVTPHIATFGGTSYQIANIGSVHVVRRKKYNPLAVIIFVLGLCILGAGIVKSHMTELMEEYSSMAATWKSTLPWRQLGSPSWWHRFSFNSSGRGGYMC